MYVYLIGNSQLCKIGMATRPAQRALELDCPQLPFSIKLLASYDAGYDAHTVEKALHVIYEKRHLRGEWFTAIDPKEFLKFAKRLYAATPHKKKPVKPKTDSCLAWLKEKAIGERMAVFIADLERNPRC
jgi:Meiotically up-regulated gene 113